MLFSPDDAQVALRKCYYKTFCRVLWREGFLHLAESRGGCTGIPAAPWWLLVVTYRGAANCSNEGGQLGGEQAAFILWELRAGAVLKPSQGKMIWDGKKCFPVALCLKCHDWANCLEFGILSLENEGRALLSYSIFFQLMFPRHFTVILFPSIKAFCNSICTI